MSHREDELRVELLARMQVEQAARHAHADAVAAGADPGESWAPVRVIDEENLAFLVPVIERHGWLGSDLVEVDGAHACWLLVQHAPPHRQAEWLPLMRAAVAEGRAAERDLVYLEDRVATHEDRPQHFGTQYVGHGGGPARLWPVSDPNGVNERRARLGLPPVPAEDLDTMWTAEEIAEHHL